MLVRLRTTNLRPVLAGSISMRGYLISLSAEPAVVVNLDSIHADRSRGVWLLQPLKIPVTSNIWTHVWSIKYKLITKLIT